MKEGCKAFVRCSGCDDNCKLRMVDECGGAHRVQPGGRTRNYCRRLDNERICQQEVDVKLIPESYG